MMLKLLSLLLLVSTLNVLPVSGNENAVVLSLDGIEVSPYELEHRFSITMVIRAIQSGTPVKDQSQIQASREQHLEQRANELVILQEVKNRNLVITEEQLATSVAEYVETMGWQGNLEGNLQMVGFRDESELIEMIHEKLLIQALIAELENHFTGLGLGGIELRHSIQQQIKQFRDEYNLQIYPEHLIYQF